MLTLFITAFALGLVFNAAPGPVFAETVRRSVHGGFRSALAVQVGSLVGDASWAVLGLAGVGLLMQLDALRVPLAVAGIAYLLWLAWSAWRAASHTFSLTPHAPVRAGSAWRSGATISLTNPDNLAFWGAIGSTVQMTGTAEPGAAGYAVCFAGFMAASIVWSFFCAWAVSALFKRAGVRWARATYRLCAAAFLLLALSALRALLQPVPDAAASRNTPAAVGQP